MVRGGRLCSNSTFYGAAASSGNKTQQNVFVHKNKAASHMALQVLGLFELYIIVSGPRPIGFNNQHERPDFWAMSELSALQLPTST